jgi:two-component system, NtrC family, response regulator GlrR
MGLESKSDAKILLVDDDPGMLQLLTMRLAASGYKAATCESGREALAYMRREVPAAVVTDLRMEPMDGMTLFRQIQEQWPNIPVIMLTAHGSIREAVEATQQGLFSFLTKPVDNRELLCTLEQALEVGCGAGPDQGWSDDILTRNDNMLKLLEQTRLLARSDINVLINGESGTGKELLAQALHKASGRRDKNFVAVNCSAIPADLLESELFGHVKGAFTGAVQNREGLFLAADGGTLFLDEIGDMPAPLQVKLLRVLQEQKVRPVGDSQDRKINVRVLSATHRDLDQAIADQDFREDLYYRLNVASLTLPPLRERKEDILLLAKSFLERIAKRTGEMTKQISPQGQQLLLQYHWPGNIRQLHNIIEQVVALSPTPIVPDTLIMDALPGEHVPLPIPLKDAKKQFEREYLVQLLHTTKGNISEAARLSGRNRSDFYKIMKRHDLGSEQFKHD